MSRQIITASVLVLSLALSACGNKGPLVKPEPAGAEAKAAG